MVQGINNKDFLKTLSRGLSLIKSFDRETPKMTLTEVAKKNHMSRASARRFVLTLESLGYLERIEDYFQLTPNILDIGKHYLENLNFIEIITPFMREVSQKVGKACSASILNGMDIVYIARIPSQQQILSVNLNIGSHLPAYCTSMGRIMLSDLSEGDLELYLKKAALTSYTDKTIVDPDQLRQVIRKVKKEGYSLVNQELEKSLRAIAVPVRNNSGRVICAINVGIPVGQVKMDEVISNYLPVLKAAAKKAEKGLTYHAATL
jgi:IclR family pca regulon transcriptional regulator